MNDSQRYPLNHCLIIDDVEIRFFPRKVWKPHRETGLRLHCILIGTNYFSKIPNILIWFLKLIFFPNSLFNDVFCHISPFKSKKRYCQENAFLKSRFEPILAIVFLFHDYFIILKNILIYKKTILRNGTEVFFIHYFRTHHLLYRRIHLKQIIFFNDL